MTRRSFTERQYFLRWDYRGTASLTELTANGTIEESSGVAGDMGIHIEQILRRIVKSKL
jgi:hypothetical protein